MPGKTGFTKFILRCLTHEENAYMNDPGLGEAVYTYLAYNHLAMKYSISPKTTAEYIRIVRHHGKLPPEVIAFTIENYKDPMIDLQKDLNDTDKIVKLLVEHAPHFLHRLVIGGDVLRIPVKERDEYYTDYRSKEHREFETIDFYNAYIFKSDLSLLKKNAYTYFWMAYYRPGLFNEDWVFTIRRPQEPSIRTKPRLRIIEGGKKQN